MEDVDIAKVGEALWEAPFAVLAHDKFQSEEPRFTYANQAALDLWEATWDELVGMPSRQSAEDQVFKPCKLARHFSHQFSLPHVRSAE